MNPKQAGFSEQRLQRVSHMLQGYVERSKLARIGAKLGFETHVQTAQGVSLCSRCHRGDDAGPRPGRVRR